MKEEQEDLDSDDENYRFRKRIKDRSMIEESIKGRLNRG